MIPYFICFFAGFIIGNRFFQKATDLYLKSIRRKDDYVFKKILEAGELRKENKLLKEKLGIAINKPNQSEFPNSSK